MAGLWVMLGNDRSQNPRRVIVAESARTAPLTAAHVEHGLARQSSALVAP